MKFQINPSRIKLIDSTECLLVSPKKSSRQTISGGAFTTQDTFLLVDSKGNTMQNKDKTLKTYNAKKPSLAAVKAYYSLVRGNDFPTTLMDSTNIHLIREEALKIASKVDVDIYMEKVKHSRCEPPSVIYLRRPDSNKIMKYVVQYNRVLKPNKHEIEIGITKVAHAIKQ